MRRVLEGVGGRKGGGRAEEEGDGRQGWARTRGRGGGTTAGNDKGREANEVEEERKRCTRSVLCWLYPLLRGIRCFCCELVWFACGFHIILILFVYFEHFRQYVVSLWAGNY